MCMVEKYVDKNVRIKIMNWLFKMLLVSLNTVDPCGVNVYKLVLQPILVSTHGKNIDINEYCNCR